MADARLQGGDWALLGFYYQMIMLLGLGTLNNEPLQAADGDTRLLVKTFTANEEHTLRFEDAGQDISIIAGGKRLLCQAKHSSNPKTTFDPSSFREILASFASSLEYIDKQGGPAVCGCILLTNRIPHAVVALIKIIVQQCRDALGWKANQVNQLPVKSSAYANLTVTFKKGRKLYNQPLKSLVEHWLTDYHRNGKVKKAHDEVLVEQALRVLPGLYFVTEAHQHDFERTFISFAKRYGALDDKIEDAKNQLVGELMGGIKIKHLLTKKDFIKAITDYKDALELTPKGIGQYCVAEWDNWCKARNARPEWIAFRSDIQSEFEQALQENKRLIFLIGEGGCGKTELLTQLTQSRVDMLRNSNSFDGFVVLESCFDLQSDWFIQAVGRWANRGIGAEQSLDQPYTHLTIANPDVKHLLFVGFDGLDENFPDESVLKRTIEDVRSRNDVCLIMTSRGREYKDVHRYINRWSRSSYTVPEQDIAIISVNELQANDLQEVVQKGTHLDIRNYAGWKQISSGGTNDVPMSLEAAFNARNLRVPSEVDSFIVSLKHPRLLGAFIDVGQHEIGTAEAALRGDVLARNKVANAFVKQFLSKYEHRRERNDLPSTNNFAVLLCELAKATFEVSVALTETTWSGIAVEIGIVRKHEAEELFEEAASGGIISIVDENAANREWKWKHGFVVMYLADTPFRMILP